MKTIASLITRLATETEFHLKYPEYHPEDRKTHLLFVGPDTTAHSYYRMLSFYNEINKTTSHAAIVSHIRTFDFNKAFDDYENTINSRLIKWADYIIFPMIFSDYSYVFEAIRKINRDAVLVMELEKNVHELAKGNHSFTKVKKNDPVELLKNLALMDLIASENEPLLFYYDRLLSIQYPTAQYDLVYFPSLISGDSYEHVVPVKDKSDEKIRIGCLGAAQVLVDTKLLKEILPKLFEHYGSNIEVIFYNLYLPKDCQADLNGSEITLVKPTTFFKHFQTLVDLQLDIALLCYSQHELNSYHASVTAFQELAVIGVPVIAPSIISGIEELIEDGINGFIADTPDTILETTQSLIENKEMRVSAGTLARQRIWKEASFTKKSLSSYLQLFP